MKNYHVLEDITNGLLCNLILGVYPKVDSMDLSKQLNFKFVIV